MCWGLGLSPIWSDLPFPHLLKKTHTNPQTTTTDRGRLPSFEELLELAYGSDMPATEDDPLRQARAHVRGHKWIHTHGGRGCV